MQEQRGRIISLIRMASLEDRVLLGDRPVCMQFTWIVGL